MNRKSFLKSTVALFATPMIFKLPDRHIWTKPKMEIWDMRHKNYWDDPATWANKTAEEVIRDLEKASDDILNKSYEPFNYSLTPNGKPLIITS